MDGRTDNTVPVSPPTVKVMEEAQQQGSDLSGRESPER